MTTSSSNTSINNIVGFETNNLLLQKSLGMSSGIVVIPTYNEIENIELIIRAVFALDESFDVLIVDDNSPDGTSDKVRDLQLVFPERLHLEIRKEKSGLGTAYIHGFKWCLGRDYQYILFHRTHTPVR